MGDNGKLEMKGGNGILETSILGKAETVNLGQAGDKPRTETPPPPPTEFKVAEIWIRQGRIMIDAPQEFWNDKARARGLLLYCDDIVREAKMEQPKIIPAKGNFLNGIRNAFKRK